MAIGIDLRLMHKFNFTIYLLGQLHGLVGDGAAKPDDMNLPHRMEQRDPTSHALTSKCTQWHPPTHTNKYL